MSTATPPLRLDDDVFAAAGTITVLLAVVAAGLSFVAANDPVNTIEGAEQTRESSGVPVALAALVIVESLAIVGLYALYRRLSDRWQSVVRKLLGVGVAIYIIHLVYLLFGVLGVLYLAVGAPTLVLLSRIGLYWHAQNLAAIGLAAIAAVLLGTIIGPYYMVGLLVALLAWDRVAVTDTDVMQRLVEVAAKTGLPAYIVFAQRIRLDDDAVRDSIVDGEELPTGVAGLIGTGDFVFPTAFVVSVAIAVQQAGGALTSTVVVAPIVMLVVSAGSMWLLKGDDMVPALPWLNGGVILGFLVALALNGGAFA